MSAASFSVTSMELPPARVQIATWQAAEANAAAWMRYWGFSDAAVTNAGADAGIDVRATRAVAQVKFQAAQVGRPAVQQLVGAAHAAPGAAHLFFTGAGYSEPAVEYAEAAGVALLSYTLDGQVQPVNGAARRLLASLEAAVVAQAAAIHPAARTPGIPVRRGTTWLVVGIIFGLSALAAMGRSAAVPWWLTVYAVVGRLIVTVLFLARWYQFRGATSHPDRRWLLKMWAIICGVLAGEAALASVADANGSLPMAALLAVIAVILGALWMRPDVSPAPDTNSL